MYIYTYIYSIPGLIDSWQSRRKPVRKIYISRRTLSMRFMPLVIRRAQLKASQTPPGTFWHSMVPRGLRRHPQTKKRAPLGQEYRTNVRVRAGINPFVLKLRGAIYGVDIHVDLYQWNVRKYYTLVYNIIHWCIFSYTGVYNIHQCITMYMNNLANIHQRMNI